VFQRVCAKTGTFEMAYCGKHSARLIVKYCTFGKSDLWLSLHNGEHKNTGHYEGRRHSIFLFFFLQRKKFFAVLLATWGYSMGCIVAGCGCKGCAWGGAYAEQQSAILFNTHHNPSLKQELWFFKEKISLKAFPAWFFKTAICWVFCLFARDSFYFSVVTFFTRVYTLRLPHDNSRLKIQSFD